MKKMKHLIIALFMSMSFVCQAQLPNGSVAPDFTVTDIDGVQHNLNTYMAQGKTVFLDFFNALCSGCWNYHHYESMDKIYGTYGHEGTGELVVLYLDGVSYDNLASITGYSEFTYGDWVGDSRYPIVLDGQGVRGVYQVPSYPHFVKICPNGNGQGVLENLNLSNDPNNYLAYMNSCSAPSTINNHGQLFDSEITLCQTNTGSPEFKFRNLGDDAVTSAVVNLYEDGVEVAEFNYSGSINKWDDEVFVFNNVNLNFQSNYTAKVTSINGVAAHNEGIVTSDLSVLDASIVALDEVIVQVTTGYDGSQAFWDLKDASGSLLSSGGPFNDFPFGTTPSFQDQPDVIVPLTANTCYEFTMRATDEFPWTGQNQMAIEDTTVRRYILKNPDQSILHKAKKYPVFVGSETVYFRTYENASVDKIIINENDFTLYPNPSQDLVTLTSSVEGCFEYNITDLSGRIVKSDALVCTKESKAIDFNTSDWKSGYYNVNIYVEGELQIVKKLMKL